MNRQIIYYELRFFVIKDNNGNIEASLTITTALRDQMTSSIQKRIIHNLEATKELLKIQGYEKVCAGLYSYAIEEYGKILFLKSFPVSATNEFTFPYRRDRGKGFLIMMKNFPGQ